MSHLFLLYDDADQEFAHQLSVQLQQRGLAIWPVPDPNALKPRLEPDMAQGFEAASHLVGIISPQALQSEAFQQKCDAALASKKTVIALNYRAADLPEHMKACPVVEFEGTFLLAVESLVKHLRSVKAPTRPLTVEFPVQVSKPGLLPIALPSERCWRDDRVRINYRLPIILSREEMEMRVPEFFARARFEVTKSDKKEMRGQRMREFSLFDPRRAHQVITVQRHKSDLRVSYRMTRVQVYHWFPAHYHVLNREAAALYRYLVTGELSPMLLEPVYSQGLRARLVSWGTILGALILIGVIIWLILI